MADMYLVTHSDMTGVAEEIRAKSGKTDPLAFPNGWKEAIKGLSSEEQLKASEYPAYVRPEVLEIVDKVSSVKQSDSIVFVAMSDSHHPADQVLNFYDTECKASTVQANQAAKSLAYLLDVDFFAHLGDVSCGHATTTPEMLKTQIEGFNAYFREAKSDLPVFVCIGNHDSGIYYHNKQTDGEIHTLSGEYLYNNFTALSESDNTVVGGRENGGYCYRDFSDKKLRVIMLNTSEQLIGAQSDNGTYGAQRAWLANALLDLNTKSDASNWGFIVLSHYPADLGSSTMKVSQLLGAYVNGGSITVTDSADGTNQTFNFSGKNGAKFIAQFHGHLHNFLTSRLYSNITGSLVQYDAWRVCVPNGEFNRENSYGEILGINWGEDTVYPKTYNTANGTSFVVNVINPSEQKIYSFCYGAGYDRVIGYAATAYYSISATLRNVTSSNDAVSIAEGAAYTATLTVADGYELKTITVTMGGQDITSTAYSGGVVSIAEVTGNIVITATAAEIVNYVNQLAISTDTDGSIYNGVGYKENSYLSAGNVGTRNNVYTTGFIPCKAGDTLYFKNVGMQGGQSNHRFSLYTSEKTYITNGHFDTTQFKTTSGGNGMVTITFGSDGNVEKVKIESHSYTNNMGYLRFCCGYLGSDSIVTKNEEIT